MPSVSLEMHEQTMKGVRETEDINTHHLLQQHLYKGRKQVRYTHFIYSICFAPLEKLDWMRSLVLYYIPTSHMHHNCLLLSNHPPSVCNLLSKKLYDRTPNSKVNHTLHEPAGSVRG